MITCSSLVQQKTRSALHALGIGKKYQIRDQWIFIARSCIATYRRCGCRYHVNLLLLLLQLQFLLPTYASTLLPDFTQLLLWACLFCYHKPRKTPISFFSRFILFSVCVEFFVSLALSLLFNAEHNALYLYKASHMSFHIYMYIYTYIHACILSSICNRRLQQAMERFLKMMISIY